MPATSSRPFKVRNAQAYLKSLLGSQTCHAPEHSWCRTPATEALNLTLVHVGGYLVLHDVNTTLCSAEEPAKDSNPFGQLLGGNKKAAKEADKSSKQVLPCRVKTGMTILTSSKLPCNAQEYGCHHLSKKLPHSICYWLSRSCNVDLHRPSLKALHVKSMLICRCVCPLSRRKRM